MQRRLARFEPGGSEGVPAAYPAANRRAAWRATNPYRAWRGANPRKARAASSRRRPRRPSANPAGPGLQAIQGTYVMTRIAQITFARPVHVDHIFPLSKGGAHEVSNLRLMFASANSSKGAQITLDSLLYGITTLTMPGAAAR